MNIINKRITFEEVVEFGLTELIRTIKGEPDKYPEDFYFSHGGVKGSWTWFTFGWYRDAENSNWVYQATSNKTYLLYFNDNLYIIKVKQEGDTINEEKGGKYHIDYTLQSIFPLLPQSCWKREAMFDLRDATLDDIRQNGWVKYEIIDGIPFDNREISQSEMQSVKEYFKEFLYAIKLDEYTEDAKRWKAIKKDHNLDVIIEIK